MRASVFRARTKTMRSMERIDISIYRGGEFYAETSFAVE